MNSAQFLNDWTGSAAARRPYSALLSAGCCLLLAQWAGAQTCYFYSDNVDAPVPIECVGLAGGQGACVTDGDCVGSDICVGGTCWDNCSWPSNCTTVTADDPQTILDMHERWHDCFGAVGGASPPAGRSQRWYAFHRQFELDFNLWRDDNTPGLGHIESIEWCPDILLPHGHPSAQPGGIPGHPAGCGNGAPRPDDVVCESCEAFPPCLFFEGAGPAGCSAGTSDFVCAGGVDRLEDFPNVDEVAKSLDSYLHGIMHTAVGVADGDSRCVDGGNNGNVCTSNFNCPGGTCASLVGDSFTSSCSPRDPMFWRLHKALDDVVRAWQDHKAVDVMVVIDTSGSMSELDSSGATKLDAALDAVDMFADLLEESRSDGQANRIGVVSFSNSATLRMPLTDADATLRNPGGPLDLALNAIQAAGPAGCTGIGPGIERAIQELCPPGDCQGFSAGGDNDRKALLVLTDGMENRPPCLKSIDPTPGGPCGSTCRGDQLDINKLEFTQLVTVGFGNAGSLNGDLLTLLAERQGGVYMQNPNGAGDDLKDFFAKAFGTLSDEFLLVDPKIVLPSGRAASEPVFYTSCFDSKLTFLAGWKDAVQPRSLRLIVTNPDGNLVLEPHRSLEATTEALWDFVRIRFPGYGDPHGTWRAHLIRRHAQFVNGFTPDAFQNPDQGIAIIRRQIQRLCPEGCDNVLFAEFGRIGPESAYEKATMIERDHRVLRSVDRATSPMDFADKLRDQEWDLIVYAYMGADVTQPYDPLLSNLFCQRQQRAIITDVRPSPRIQECLRVSRDGNTNLPLLFGDARLVDGAVPLVNRGYPVFSYGLTSVGPTDVQATFPIVPTGGIVAVMKNEGSTVNAFVDILGRGLSKLDPHLFQSLQRTTDGGLTAVVRILPSNMVAGGFDEVQARVEVEFPRVGLGCFIEELGLDEPRQVRGEILDSRAATIGHVPIPTGTATFTLYDDGTHGDLLADNYNWSAKLEGIPVVDGIYRLHYILEMRKHECITRRELVRSVFVDITADPAATMITVQPGTTLPDGRRITPVRFRPGDGLDNCWGPGRTGTPTCEPSHLCTIDPDRGIVDQRDGSYLISLLTREGTAGARVHAFNGQFDVPIPCPTCPSLTRFTIDPTTAPEHTTVTGRVALNRAAPREGAVVFLLSDDPNALVMPTMVIVPAGQTSVEFPIEVFHGEPEKKRGHDHGQAVRVTATYGAESMSATVTIVPGTHALGDCNADRVTDITDFAPFPGCLTGPQMHDHGYTPSDPACVCTDLDANGSHDLRDVASFQLLLHDGK